MSNMNMVGHNFIIHYNISMTEDIKFQVNILREEFQIEAKTSGKAKRKAARLYVDKCGEVFPIEALVAFASVRRLDPKKPGRKSIYTKGLG